MLLKYFIEIFFQNIELKSHFKIIFYDKKVLGCTQTYVDILKHTQIYSNIRRYTQTYVDILKHTQIYANIRRYIQTYANIPKNIKKNPKLLPLLPPLHLSEDELQCVRQTLNSLLLCDVIAAVRLFTQWLLANPVVASVCAQVLCAIHPSIHHSLSSMSFTCYTQSLSIHSSHPFIMHPFIMHSFIMHPFIMHSFSF